MNYHKLYDNLINRAKNRVLVEYSETHHIIPKCMGGTDDKSNLVNLTPEEHFLCHQLLVKMYPNNRSLIYAATMMCVSNDNVKRNNKRFGWLRRRHAETTSLLKKGTKNSKPRSKEAIEASALSRRGKKNTKEHKEKCSKALKGREITSEWREKISIAGKGRIDSDETKKKKSIASKENNSRPEVKAIQSAKRKEWWAKRKASSSPSNIAIG